MSVYQIGIYNRHIRDKVRSGDDVDPVEAEWENVHYFDIEAESEQQAKDKIRLEYKESKGFVIDFIDIYKSF